MDGSRHAIGVTTCNADHRDCRTDELTLDARREPATLVIPPRCFLLSNAALNATVVEAESCSLISSGGNVKARFDFYGTKSPDQRAFRMAHAFEGWVGVPEAFKLARLELCLSGVRAKVATPDPEVGCSSRCGGDHGLSCNFEGRNQPGRVKRK